MSLIKNARGYSLAIAIISACFPCASMTGNELHELMEKNDTGTLYYVIGLHESAQLSQAAEQEARKGAPSPTLQSIWGCPPSTVNYGQMRDVIALRLRTQPQYRHLSAVAISASAMAAAWPCPRSKKTE